MAIFASFSRAGAAGLVAVCLAVAAAPSQAASIGGVEVLPAAPVDGDSSSLRVDLEYPSSGFLHYDTLVSYESATAVVVDLLVSAPGPGEYVLFVLESELVDVPLGTVFAGHYDFTVNLVEFPRNTTLSNLTDRFTGGFDVLPEPAVLPLAVALVALLGTRRRAS